MSKVKIMQGVRFTDKDGKKHVLNREEFDSLMRKLARRAKAIHNMKVIEEMETED